jgi:hypothetical protein
MFVLDDNDGERVVKGIPVTVKTVGDNGAVTKSNLTLDYRILPTDETDAIIRAGQEGAEDADLVKRVVVGWGQVKNKAGETVEFSAQMLDAACRQANFRAAALDGYFRTAAGEKPRKGN